jgi:prepilin-type N-terminal cleavage/methylation domain-containing protein
MPSRFENGFTAVEVMITLFIIGFILASGYQAYALVSGDSSDIRLQAEASNIAYETLRRVSDESTDPCSTQSPSVSIPSTSTLPTPRTLTANISCPFGTTSTVSLVTVSLTYGPSNQEVIHAVYSH